MTGEINLAAFDVLTMRLTQARGVLTCLELNLEDDGNEARVSPKVLADCINAASELLGQAEQALQCLQPKND